jgi:hypothetical protein
MRVMGVWITTIHPKIVDVPHLQDDHMTQWFVPTISCHMFWWWVNFFSTKFFYQHNIHLMVQCSCPIGRFSWTTWPLFKICFWFKICFKKVIQFGICYDIEHVSLSMLLFPMVVSSCMETYLFLRKGVNYVFWNYNIYIYILLVENKNNM